MNTSRPSWDDTWLAVADTIALRSVCDGRQVGAVIVNAQNRAVSTGYNGPPRNYPVDSEARCSSFCARQMSRGDGAVDLAYGLSCPTVHAEANALIFADRSAFAGGTIYVTAACCPDCGKLIANSGLTRVVMRLDSRDLHRRPYDTVELLRACGLDVEVREA